MKEYIELPKDVFVYLIATYIITWTIWIIFFMYGPSVEQIAKREANTPLMLLFLLGNYIPSIIGLLMIFKEKHIQGIKDVFYDIKTNKIPTLWVYAVLTIPMLFILPGILIARFIKPTPVNLLAIAFSFTIGIFTTGIGEEFGWRKFMLERLEKKYKTIRASQIVGLAWGIWQLPILFMSARGLTVTFFVQMILYVISTCAVSVIIGIMYKKTKQNILLAIIFHAGFTAVFNNIAIYLNPTFIGSWIPYLSVVLMIILTAVGFVRYFKVK